MCDTTVWYNAQFTSHHGEVGCMVLYAVPECQSESKQELYIRRNGLFPGYGDFYNVSMTVHTNTTELILCAI